MPRLYSIWRISTDNSTSVQNQNSISPCVWPIQNACQRQSCRRGFFLREAQPKTTLEYDTKKLKKTDERILFYTN